MLKSAGWWSAVTVLVLVSGCATAPAPVDAPRPEEPVPSRPAQPGREAPLRIGVVVSTSGSATLQQYGELVLGGAHVGAAAAGTARRDVELVIRDDGGTAAGAARAVRELEAVGIRAIVGPLTEAALAAAAQARSSDAVILISPMAVADPAGVRNVYALNVVDSRGAAALGEYARRFARVGVLYSRTTDGTRQARAFVDAYNAGGRGTMREAAYDSGATNISTALARLREARVEAVFVPGTERQLQIVLPQVEYFGLGNAQMLGNEAWLTDGSRGLPPRLVQGAVIATPLFQDSDELAWREFVSRYEAHHRRSLENPVPALGYDAVLLAVRALTGGNTDADFRGATGVLSLRGDAVTRKPFLVRIDAGRLVRVN
jgi:ABC-type branched-subunit amino acid transport system substrate-binding protein